MRTFRQLHTLHAARMILGLLAALLLTSCGRGAAQSGGGQKPPMSPDAQTAATRALEPLRKLVTPENARDMGFESVSEAANAALGEPIRVQMVRLDALRSYTAGADPGPLLTEVNRVLYPVTVNNQVRSSVIVEGSGGQWTFSSFGGPALVRQVSRYRTDITNRLKPAADSVTVVHVSALNLYFLGYRVDNRLLLTPLENHPTYKLEAGASVPADEVFAALAPFARDYNGLPL
jgi:hypothetical protein